MNEIQLKKDVMSRITTIYWLRRIAHPIRLKFVLFCIGLLVLRELTSVRSIFNNFFENASAGRVVSYLLDAFTHAEVTVLLAFVVTAAAACWMCADLLITLKSRVQLRA